MEVRRKVRLRIYDPAGETAVLELKQKQGDQQRKRSLRLTREDAMRLIAGDYSPLRSCGDGFAAEMYALMTVQCYRPKTIVQYDRKAFVAKENRIRITFDRNILATESSVSLFDPGLLMNPVLPESQTVMEVKYDGFLLSYIKELLNDLNRSELSVSKYCLARQSSYQGNL